MLLIGDIHANARRVDAILDTLKKYCSNFSDEKNVMFLGDYMYMFSYDRQALGDLFDFFLQLRGDGKNVYILAGNHDWLNQHFVYHEGKKIADTLVNSLVHSSTMQQKIYFITEPEVHTIEGKEILFMPYNKKFLGDYMNRSSRHPERSEGSRDTVANHNKEAISGFFGSASEGQAYSPKAKIALESSSLLGSTNYTEQLSGALNHYLLEHYKEGMTLMHHYYTAKTPFPGQQAQFDYKDISLHPGRMTYSTRVISGHLHKAFSYENYLCTGSVWSTTSGERNQCKWLWKRDTNTDTFEASEIAINPYVSSKSSTLSLPELQSEMNNIRTEHISLFDKSVKIAQKTDYDMAATSLILYSADTVASLETLLDPELKQTLGDIQIKQISSHKDMTELLDISQYNIKQSLLDWKELVKKYLLSRYGAESEKYRTVLSELNIL